MTLMHCMSCSCGSRTGFRFKSSRHGTAHSVVSKSKIKPELINQKYPRVSKEVWPSQSNQPAHSFPYRLTPNSYGASFDNRKDLKLDPPLLRACMYCWVWKEKKPIKIYLYMQYDFMFRSKGRDLILRCICIAQISASIYIYYLYWWYT